MSESADRTSYLVIGATGNVGSLVVPALLERGEDIRCMVRNPEKAKALREAGAEVVTGDLDDIETVESAMAGIDTVFLVISINPNMRQQGLDAIDAAVKCGVGRVVRYTAVRTDFDDQMLTQRIQREIDEKLESSGLSYSHVRPHNYMQGLFAAAPTIQSDSAIYLPWGDARVATCDLRDIADAAIEVLTGDGHHGKAYSITGPEALTVHEIAEAISDVIGKTVSYVDIPPQATKDALMSMGLDEWTIDQYLRFYEAFAKNHANVVYDDFERLVGRKPRSIQDFARDFAGVFNPEVAAAQA